MHDPEARAAELQQPVNVLLVDDRPANLLALEALLEGPDLNLVRASSGEEALRLLERDDFAVVLLDVEMPTLSGFETARLLRARERSAHTPVIFVTARDADPGPVAQAYELGAVDFLNKPLVPAALRAKVGVFVELARRARRIESQAERLHLAQRERAERRATVQYAVAGLLAGAADLAEAAGGVLKVTCEGLGWDAAALWSVVGRQSQALSLDGFWASPAVMAAALEADSRQRRPAPGEGLPGTAWAGGEPVWVEDAAQEANFPRAALALAAGLRGACAVPILQSGKAVGVLECFACEVRPRDEGLVRALGAVGGQVGQSLERRRAERELRRSRAELEDFVENATVGMHRVGPDGRVLWANRAELEMLGYQREEYVGRHVSDFHADPEVIEDILRRLAGGEALDGREARLLCKDGSVKHVLISSNVLREAGEFVHTRCFTRDITERKQAEEALKEAGRRKDAFLAMLAHELRNPLATLPPALQAIRQAGADPAVRAASLERLERQARHLTRLVDDLLEASRVAHGRVSIRPERIDLARLARTAAEDRRPLLEGAGLALSVETPQTPVWVSGDATRLEQVLHNLLDNAARFCDAGSRVAVQVGADADQAHAVLAVRDEGVGIDAQVLPRLFRPFEQAVQGLDRRRGGLGLGLSVVKGLAELHGGTAEAHSDGPGRGATFTVRLPLVAEPKALTEVPQSAAPSGRGAKVLIVEDNRDAADSLDMLLKLLGHKTRVARTGPEGVQAASEFLPDVILCDIGLPGFDGFEVARRVRALAGLEGALLVAVSGYAGEEDRRRGREAGFDHHLPKPADPSALRRVLEARTA